MTITSNLPCGLAILSAMLSARPHESRVKSAGEARSFRSRYSSSDLKQKRRTPSVRRRCVAVSFNRTVRSERVNTKRQRWGRSSGGVIRTDGVVLIKRPEVFRDFPSVVWMVRVMLDDLPQDLPHLFTTVQHDTIVEAEVVEHEHRREQDRPK